MNESKSETKDPVCGMTVDKATAIHAERDGTTFYFCSEHCRQKFLATPAGAKPASMNPYPKFAAMIATSTVVMFGLMYLNTYSLDHIFFSETRAYMALVMGATMAVVMLGFMLQMYHNRKANIGIFVGSAVVFAASLWLVRSQATIEDVSWMKAMIPHHSIAILTSERAHISDPRTRKLADDIIEAQRKEIAEMKALIEDLEKKR